MCGRFTLTLDQEALSVAYGVEAFLTSHAPRYNIAPSQEVAVLVQGDGIRRVDGFRWGLVPSWARDPSIGNRMINARSETVADKPAFRNAWVRGRRCLVLADGFYEWQAPPDGSGPKVPHWIHRVDRRPFGFAGLWERWGHREDPLFTCTILTTRPNAVVRPIHDRMPVLLGAPHEWDRWVDPSVPSRDLEELLAPSPDDALQARVVSTRVNRPGNEGPECIRPVE